MEVIYISPLYNFLNDLNTIARSFNGWFRTLFQTLYAKSDWNFLFYCAMLPFLLMFVFDLIMSFILSIRHRELKFFNCFSPKSWRIIGEQRNHTREVTVKYTRLSSLAVGMFKYKNARAGDVIRHKDGTRSTYLGARLHNGQYVYAYKTKNGIVFSTLKPSKWAKANGSERAVSTVKVFKKNNK